MTVRSMLSFRLCLLLASVFQVVCDQSGQAQESVFLWPQLAEGLRPEDVGEFLPARVNEAPPAIRITNIDHPYLVRFDPPRPVSGRPGVILLPGGGYRYAVVGKEGQEVARWLNELGITAFVLHYRTPTRDAPQDWLAPVQDAQRAVRLVRSQSDWGVDPERICLLGFSAGGNAAAIAATNFETPLRSDVGDQVDELSARPDLLMLLYPWQLLNDTGRGLRKEVVVDQQTPPTLLIHAHDDSATSLSSIEFYRAMHLSGRSAELHIFANGGHGYGLRMVPQSRIHTWTDRAADWLQMQRFVSREE